MPSTSNFMCIRFTKFEAIMSKSLEDTITRNVTDGGQNMDRILYPNLTLKILYEGYDKYLILDIEAISLSLSWPVDIYF